MPQQQKRTALPMQDLPVPGIHPDLLSRMSCGIVIIDPETHRVVDINDTAVSILGVARNVILNHKCDASSCLGDGEWCPFLGEIDPDTLSSEFVVDKPEGKLPVLRAFSEIKVKGKRLIVECLIDITDRKQAEFELRQHEELLQAVYENASVGMAILDMNGNFFQVNKALCEMLLYTEEELLSRQYTVTHPDDLERSEFVLAQLKEGKIRKNIMEKRYIRKDGTVIYALHNLSMIRDNKGNPFLFIIQAQDITHLKNTLRRAVEADNLKTTFLQNLSHEVRTPANAIFGFNELLKDPGCSPEEQKAYINLIQNGVEQFIFILNNIVDIAKVETHQLALRKVALDIRVLLQEVFATYSAKFNAENTPGIEFSFFMIESALPVFVECDAVRLKQALSFLLDNAFKFTKFGRITLGCHVLPEKEVILFVKDSGIGIPLEKQEFIFHKFRQGDESNTRQYGGLGLGLTLAREFITLQGGRLWLQSAPDQGTSVYCSLPYKGKKATSGNLRIPEQPIPALDLSGRTILVAEDTDNNYTVLEIWLRKTGARIIRARNGLEAIEACHQDNSIDLVLMDLQMPIVNGYSATREILAYRPALPVIAQTAYSLDFDERNALEAGCIAYLIKPLDITVLFETIKLHIRQTATH